MLGVRFYLEFKSRSAKKRSGKQHKGHSGNVLAAFWVNGPHYRGDRWLIKGLGAVYDYPDSPVACTAACREFLDQSKRVSERVARQIHPELFRRLDEVTP